jgi:hypothetical protein
MGGAVDRDSGSACVIELDVKTHQGPRYFRTHSPVAAVPGVPHFAPAGIGVGRDDLTVNDEVLHCEASNLSCDDREAEPGLPASSENA